MLHDPRHDVLFIGYQAQGTPVRAVQIYGERGGYVDFDHERYKIGTKMNTIGGYSAHADQKGLLDFVTPTRHWPSQVRIVYGEPSAKHELGERLKVLYKDKQCTLEVVIPSGINDANL